MAQLDAILADARTSNVARDDKGRFSSVTPTETPKEETAAPEKAAEPQTPAPVETPPAAPVATPAPAQPAVSAEAEAYKKAMLEERAKRQASDRELKEFKEKQAQPQIDPYADLPGYIDQRLVSLEQQTMHRFFNVVEAAARTRYKDYDEARQAFLDAAETNPVLSAQLGSQTDPAEYVYREGLKIKELGSVNGDIGAYRSKIEKEIEERVRKEYETKYKLPPSVPASLNSESSPASVAAYGGPKPLGDLLVNKF